MNPKTRKDIVKMLLKNKQLETEDEEQLMELLLMNKSQLM